MELRDGQCKKNGKCKKKKRVFIDFDQNFEPSKYHFCLGKRSITAKWVSLGQKLAMWLVASWEAVVEIQPNLLDIMFTRRMWPNSQSWVPVCPRSCVCVPGPGVRCPASPQVDTAGGHLDLPCVTSVHCVHCVHWPGVSVSTRGGPRNPRTPTKVGTPTLTGGLFG